MSKTKKAAIAIDDYKLKVFERHLKAAGYKWKRKGKLTPGTLLLQVETTDITALGVIVQNANNECALLSRGKK